MIKVKFIFPQNYKFNAKILGIIDYQSAILILVWAGIIFFILNAIFNSLNIKIFLFIVLVFPVLIFSVVGINGENIINVIIYMSKFIIKPKLLIYTK